MGSAGLEGCQSRRASSIASCATRRLQWGSRSACRRVEAAQQRRIERLHDQHCKTHEIIRAQAARLANIHVAGRPIDVEHPRERHRVMTHRKIRVEIDGSTDLLDGLIDVVPQQECAAQSPISLRVARVEK